MFLGQKSKAILSLEQQQCYTCHPRFKPFVNKLAELELDMNLLSPHITTPFQMLACVLLFSDVCAGATRVVRVKQVERVA